MLTYEQKKIFRNNWKKLVKEGHTKNKPWLFVLYNYFIGRDIFCGFSKNLHSSKFWIIYNNLYYFEKHNSFILDNRQAWANIEYMEVYNIILSNIPEINYAGISDLFKNFVIDSHDFINIKNQR